MRSQRLNWVLSAFWGKYYQAPPLETLSGPLVGNFSRELSASVTGLNVTNEHLLTDNSLTFGGVHWNNPLQIYVQLRYRFHY